MRATASPRALPFSLLALALGLGACAEMRWQKAGGDDAALARDLTACQRTAKLVGAGSLRPPTATDLRFGALFGPSQADLQMQESQALGNCMHGKGYGLVEAQARDLIAKGVKMPPQVDKVVIRPDGIVALTAGTPPAAAAPPTPPVAVAPPPVVAAATPAPAAPAVAPAAPVTAKAAPAAPADDQQAIRQTLDRWRQAWASGDAAGYFDHYDPQFKGEARTRASWEKQRRERLANGNIEVALENLEVKTGSGKADVTFTQRYSSSRHTDTGTKQMHLRQVGGKWLIVTEKWHKKA